MSPRLFASLSIGASLVLAGPAPAEELLVDGIAAQVGTDIVLLSEVAQMVGPLERRLRAQGVPESEILKLHAEGLEQLIEARLVERVAAEANLGASDAEIDEVIDGIARENGLTREQLEASVVAQNMTYETYRDQIRQQVQRQKVIGSVVGSQIRLEEDELRSLYREVYGEQPEGGVQVHLRQLLVLGGEGAPRDVSTACRIVGEAEARIRAGEPFEELARQLSAAAPRDGGDIGWLHSDSMASWMHELIAPLEPGQMTPVKRLPFGCTLLKLVERRDFTPVDFEQARPLLEQRLYEQKVMEEYRDWMDQLRSQTFIERRGYYADAAGPVGSAAGRGPSSAP